MESVEAIVDCGQSSLTLCPPSGNAESSRATKDALCRTISPTYLPGLPQHPCHDVTARSSTTSSSSTTTSPAPLFALGLLRPSVCFGLGALHDKEPTQVA